MNVRLFFLIAPLAISAPALSQGENTPLEPLFQCRDIPNDTERLACLDAAVDALRGDTETGEVIAVAREQVEAAEEATYGLSISGLRLPGLPNFTGGSEELAEIEAADSSPDRVVTRNDDGQISRIANLRVVEFELSRRRRAVVHLDNGQVWRQSDDVHVQRPRSRDEGTLSATIRSGALGSFFMRLSNGGRWFRVERVE